MKEQELKDEVMPDEGVQPEGEAVEVEILEPEFEPGETAVLAQKCAEINDRYLRLMAEYDNFRKRTQREKENIYADATAATALKLLPTMDNLERACSYEAGSEDFKKGFDMIVEGLKAQMAALGVEAFGEVGDTFDPELHNAVSHIEDENLGENVLAQVLQKGYKLGGRVIRYAMVQTAN